VRVVTDGRADVRVGGDEVDHRLHLGLAGWVRAGADLLELLPPASGEVAVQVQPLGIGVHLHGQPVVVLQSAFGHQAKVVAAELAGLARHHQARVGAALLVAAVRVGDAHEQHAAVAVNVFHRQAVDLLLFVRIAARAGADVARPIGQRQLGAVGVQTRADVDHPGVEQVRDLHVLAELADQLVQVVQAGGAGRQLGGVDVAVGPERGLVGVDTGGRVGYHGEPDVASLVALADGAHRDQVGPCLRIGVQQVGQGIVTVEDVEAWSGQGGGHRGGSPSRANENGEQGTGRGNQLECQLGEK